MSHHSGVIVQSPESSEWWPERLALLVKDRLLLGRLAGAAVWLVWLVSLTLGGWRHDVVGHRIGADFVQYYVVGALVDEGKAEKIYDLPTMTARQAEVGGEHWEGVLPFRYPPFYALCFALTSRLPYETSWLVWTATSLLALVLAGRLLGVPMRSWIGWALCFYPVFAAVSFGQNSLFSLLLLSATFALWSANRPFAAGLVAGLLLFKQPLLAGVGVLWLLDLRRSWMALLGLAVTSIALAAVSFLVLPDASWRYVASLGDNVGMQNRGALAKLYSSQGFLMLLMPNSTPLTHLLSLLTSIVGLIVFVALCWPVRDRKPLAFSLAVLATLWLSPYAMVYDWSILLLPAAILWRELPGQRSLWLALFALVWLAALVSDPLVQAQLKVSTVAIQVSVPVLWFTVVAIGQRLTPAGIAVPGHAG
jgi:hypothetical protein